MNELVVHNAASAAGDDHVVDSLIELYLLGDVLHDVKLRNKTLRLFTTQLKTLLLVPNPEQCHLVCIIHPLPRRSESALLITLFLCCLLRCSRSTSQSFLQILCYKLQLCS